MVASKSLLNLCLACLVAVATGQQFVRCPNPCGSGRFVNTSSEFELAPSCALVANQFVCNDLVPLIGQECTTVANSFFLEEDCEDLPAAIGGSCCSAPIQCNITCQEGSEFIPSATFQVSGGCSASASPELCEFLGASFGSRPCFELASRNNRFPTNDCDQLTAAISDSCCTAPTPPPPMIPPTVPGGGSPGESPPGIPPGLPMIPPTVPGGGPPEESPPSRPARPNLATFLATFLGTLLGNRFSSDPGVRA